MKTYERFLDYVSFPTTSDENSETVPSTPSQLVLAKHIKDELLSLGLSDVRSDELGYVYATLPATEGVKAPVIGFIAHMDTSSACSGENIKPQTVLYNGGDIPLSSDGTIVMREADYPELASFYGHHIICTDGTTLLGADDKAGAAEIITAVEELMKSGEPHGEIKLGFTPDEEIGRGADHFDVEGFGADFAYTVDGGAPGEIEYECFNAASASIKVKGISIHPGTAKDKMKNAASIAIRFTSMLPPDEVPEKTSGYEGFFHLNAIEGDVENAFAHYIIRDHDREKFEARKRIFAKAAEMLDTEYGGGTVEYKITDSYYNMAEIINTKENYHIVKRALDAMESLGFTPVAVPIRGGTDGARLSYMGLPCPNLPVGGANYHSRFEFISEEALDNCKNIVKRIITDAVK